MIFDIGKSKCVFSKGYFGKPLGIRKPKSTDIDRPLELSILETCYLMELGVLNLHEGNRLVSLDELKELGRKLMSDFDMLYSTYKELRNAGFVVRSALKYGADFAIYRRRPGLEHAPYLVKVLRYGQKIDPGDLIGWGRLSHSVRKELLLAVTYPSGARTYITFKWLKP